jgi:type II secretory pathway pseudopilin PulG
MKLLAKTKPHSCHQQRAVNKQSGVILLLFVIGLFIVSSTFFLTALNNNRARQEQGLNAALALNAVKDELIAFAILGPEHFGDAGAGPGHLFCPDTNANGASNSPCGNNALGRLPRPVTTLIGTTQFSDFGAGLDQEFWFALDNSLRSSPAQVFNSATTPTLTVDGAAGFVAVLIAPGEANGLQTRPSNIPSNYLEAGNGASPSFVTSDGVAPANFNDRLLGIEFGEIITPVTARVAQAIKGRLDTYHGTSGSYPDDTSFDDPLLDDFTTVMTAPGMPAWFAANLWLNQVSPNYVRLTTDSASILFNGCAITYTLDVNIAGITRSTNQC